MTYGYAREIENLPLLLNMNGEAIGFIQEAQDIEIEHVLNDANILTFIVFESTQIEVEQEVIFKKDRYKIIKTEKTRYNGRIAFLVEAMSASIELGDRIVKKVEFHSLSTHVGLERILRGSGWTTGYVEADEGLQHAMSEENQTVLWLLFQYARIAGFEVEFDTINYKVNFVKQIGTDTDLVFQYRKNIKEIKKISHPPEATVIIPKGRGGLTIENVNKGEDFLEDYSWYTSLGISLETARQKFKREYIWEDDRFIYPGILMRRAEDELRRLSHPQIAYETNVIDLSSQKLRIGDYAAIFDHELGIQLKVRVVRLQQYPGREWENTIEFNYLTPGISNVNEGNSTSNGEKKLDIIFEKNDQPFVASDVYKQVLSLAISSFASTHAQVGLAIVGEAAENILLEGYFEINGQKLPLEIKQVLHQGWNTIGLPFIIPQIQEGSHYLNFYLKTTGGSFSIGREKLEMFVVAENLLGGLSTELPKANVVEEVEFPLFDVIDASYEDVIDPIIRPITENIMFPSFDVFEKFVEPKYINIGSVIPPMLSDTEPHPVIILASSYDTTDTLPFHAFSKMESDFWRTAALDDDIWLIVELGDVRTVNRYRVTSTKNNERAPSSWKLQGSYDGGLWIDIDIKDNVIFGKNEEKEFLLDKEVNFKHFRIIINGNNGDLVYTEIRELDLIYKV